MASKTKYSRLESEIEKCRVESKWSKSIEIAKQYSGKATNIDLDTIVTFLEGEKALEEFVECHSPLVEDNILIARATLTDANEDLTKISRGQSKFKDQALLLLTKVQFCQGFYQVALSTIDGVNLKTLTSQKNARLLYMVAETYAIKGKCLDHTKSSLRSKFKHSEREEEIIELYRCAGDCALLAMQEKEKLITSGQSLNIDSNFVMSTLLEMAIYQVPALYLKRDDSEGCVNRYRDMLRAVGSRFTQDVRKVLALDFAQFLLKSCSISSYKPPSTNQKNHSNQGPKPSLYSTDKNFVPKTLDEEVLLLLLIAEAVGTREAALERNSESHELTLTSVSSIYDLLALVLVRRAQFLSLSETFEKAMRFSYGEFHIWHQYANSLICSNKFGQAVLVLAECHRLQPNNGTVCLQAAQLCYEHLQNHDMGIKWAELATKCEEGHHLQARAHLALGVGYCMLAKDCRLLADRQNYNSIALEEFKRAQELDPQDYLAAFHLALQYASMRKINEAITICKLSLRLRNDFIHSLHLMALLLSARKQHSDAMALIHVALKEYPENLSILMTKAKLEKVVLGPEEALATYQKMLKLWKELHEIDSADDGSDSKSPARDRCTWDKRSLAQMTFNEFNERGSGSIRAESVAASRVEKALSDLASSMNSSLQPRAGPQRSWVIQAQIWLNLAELYLSLNQVKEAQGCVQETFQLFPHSVYVFFMKGLVSEYRGCLQEARVNYENAISVNPSHTKSLYRLGIVLYKLEENRLAEKVLRDAVNVDPCFHKAWFVLGTVLEALGQLEDACNCQLTGTMLEATCPIASFNVIQRIVA